MKPLQSLLFACAVLVSLHPAAFAAENFIYTSSGELEASKALLSRPEISGVQIVYNWKGLEPAKGQYDFWQIEKDLALTQSLNRKLFIQVQDRFFEPKARNIPEYMLNEPEYDGGLTAQFDNPGENKPVGSGWVAQQWNPAVRERYQALLKALAEKFDGKVYGVNLPETAIDLDPKHEPKGYSCDAYLEGEMANLAFCKEGLRQVDGGAIRQLLALRMGKRP
ncbi:hypothetical protein [Rhizobium leguminosarum]|uniref:hypothetical protein n=1 Tax=Rhizobium leguminosarum TaxID=384 RepID=UPI003F99B79A